MRQTGSVRPAALWARGLLLLTLIVPQLLVPNRAAAQEGSAGEYEIKGAMLYNLMRFVDWPASAYPAAQSPAVLCVLGRDPFGKSLASVVSDKLVDGRPVEIRRVQSGEAMRVCNILYISSSERKRLPQILAILKGTSVLTVGEMSRFAARGGMIQFALEDKQVHFDINLDAASRSGLKISSRLLALARIVKDQENDSSWEISAVTLEASAIPVYAFPRQLLSSAEGDEGGNFRRPSRDTTLS